ncbi:uncharacterized protein LOC130647313 [Hydractinia symbiolongicarpus]|uniref:uncharacterized protein LOC130647313 n=1 Tax=Hydractinia symbiolongicarpus TaxID=13093 RepID=UPI0025505543|nr:uncharacterized protein LOC130647313 [Hydractinia symbiolongicarpus]
MCIKLKKVMKKLIYGLLCFLVLLGLAPLYIDLLIDTCSKINSNFPSLSFLQSRNCVSKFRIKPGELHQLKAKLVERGKEFEAPTVTFNKSKFDINLKLQNNRSSSVTANNGINYNGTLLSKENREFIAEIEHRKAKPPKLVRKMSKQKKAGRVKVKHSQSDKKSFHKTAKPNIQINPNIFSLAKSKKNNNLKIKHSQFESSQKTLMVYSPKKLFSKNVVTNANDVYPHKCNEDTYDVLIKPCKNALAWSQRQKNYTQRTSLKFTTIDINVKPPGSVSYLKMTTFDESNLRKERGGDSWWVHVIGPVSFQVDVVDDLDGTYHAQFDFMESGDYSVVINLKYSLCHGYLDPPMWWFKKGNIGGKYQKQGILNGQRDLINEEKIYNVLVPDNPKADLSLNSLQRKSREVNYRYLNPSCGYWKGSYLYLQQKLKTFPKHTYSTGSWLWVYGDSIQKRFGESLKRDIVCREYYTCNLTYAWVYTNPQVTKKIFDDKDFNKDIILEEIKNILDEPGMQKKSSLLLLNFGLHIVMTTQLSKAQDLFRSLLSMLSMRRRASPDRFPSVAWASTTSPNEHEYRAEKSDGKEIHVDDIRFLTKQRVVLWNAFTRDELQKTDIPILNIFKVTASHPSGPTDGMHYPSNVLLTVKEAFQAYALDDPVS